MKRILALVLILIFSLQITAFAEVIRKPRDSFENSVTVYSEANNVELFNAVGLGKVIYPSSHVYGLIINKSCGYKPGVIYQINRFQIKINDQIFDIPINHQYQEVTRGEFAVYGNIFVKVIIWENLIDLIKNANKVTIRVTDSQGFNTTSDFSDTVLAEWKQVINTEE
ncbi:hypothetical protein [Anaerosinus massiliensis]|uniref:hypothetical protein n=1 Tax=Massilibacillus massiliensis TaxID=1806837 RepID=UPI000DA62644|nr:hypothetical protein [Massilibacillus massiliensis]